jgi:multiple sugar transport system permease protein/sn-glycerol 3-phosphate transport system permease protein
MQKRLTAGATYLFLTAASILFLFPLYWQLSTSLKTVQQTLTYPPIWLPNPPQWSNYVELMGRFPIFLYLGNSTFISIAVIAGTLLSCSMAAYGFARLRMPGRDAIFVLLLATLMLPGMVTLIPQFVMFQRLHWTNTFYPLIAPAFFGSALYIFMLRQFFMTIPVELEDAARIDGAGYLRSYAQIVMPLAKPALITVAILTFVATWNDFFGPLIYLSDKEKYTVAVALRYLQGSVRTRPENHLLMAAATISIIPPLVVFFFAQRQFMQGVVVSGVKG